MLQMTEKLLLLRMQIFAAMQACEGDDLREFWSLIDEVHVLRPAAELETAQ